MRIAGIIAEYNPFHAGHAYQLAQLHAQGFDAVVCVVSPGVCQRGSVCVFPADVRAAAALQGGADVIITLPAPYACATAEQFAAAGVHLLCALGCVEALAFGAETPDAARFMRTAKLLLQTDFTAALQAQLQADATQSFAAARAAALAQLSADAAALLQNPNDILGVEYAKALLRENSPMQLLPMARKGSTHADVLPQSGGFASAGALRTLLAEQGIGALQPYVPTAALALYRQAVQRGDVLDTRAFDVALLSRLRAMAPGRLAGIRGVQEGLENRLFAAVNTAKTAQELYDTAKTKRYAHARLRRLALDAALGYTAALPALPPYIHVAGATEAGLAVLKQAKQTVTLPLSDSLATLAKENSACAAIAAAHTAAEAFAALCLQTPRPADAAYTGKFIRI